MTLQPITYIIAYYVVRLQLVQVNDLSIYNISQRLATAAMGARAKPEIGSMLLETCALYHLIVPSISSPHISAYRAATETLVSLA